VCAEDAARDFLPGAGQLLLADWPSALEGVRVDAGFTTGDSVPPHYDSLLGKIVAHAPTRELAIARLRSALGDTRIAGVPSNVGWLAAALDTAAFRRGAVSTAFVAEHGAALGARLQGVALAPFAAAAKVFALRPSRAASPWACADGFRLSGSALIDVPLSLREDHRRARVALSGGHAVTVTFEGLDAAGATIVLERAAGADVPMRLRLQQGGAHADALVSGDAVDIWRDGVHARFVSVSADTAAGAVRRPAGNLTSLLPGVVVSVLVAQGQQVRAGQALLVIEAMKMEHAIRAPHAGVVRTLKYRSGERVKEGTTLAELDEER